METVCQADIESFDAFSKGLVFLILLEPRGPQGAGRRMKGAGAREEASEGHLTLLLLPGVTS